MSIIFYDKQLWIVFVTSSQHHHHQYNRHTSRTSPSKQNHPLNRTFALDSHWIDNSVRAHANVIEICQTTNYYTFLGGGGQDNLLRLIPSPDSPSSALWLSTSSCLLQLPTIESSELVFPSLHWGGVKYLESPPEEALGVMSEEECWPTRSCWRVANESLMAVMASKNRVHDAKAAGMGRNISFTQRRKELSSLNNIFKYVRWYELQP